MLGCNGAWLTASLLTIATFGCTSIRIADDDSESGDDVSDPLPGSDEPEWTAACPASSALEEVGSAALGDCSNQPLEGALTLQNAEDLLYRVVHEAGHLASLVAGSEGGLATSTEDGTHFEAFTDDGYLTGALPSGWETADSSCAIVEFGCWTGGHGGWGPSALAGVALIDITLADGVVTRVRVASHSLWLVESGPLSGTPPTAVSADITLEDGEISGLSATVGEHQITR
jgi:hypothetical protein